MNLPSSDILPVERLTGVFNSTTNSYKFYWFLSILESLRANPEDKISIPDLLIEMIGSVWYPIIYFRLSFGKQDQFTSAIKEIQYNSNYSNEINKLELISLLKKSKHEVIIRNLIDELSRYVPYRFLSPWFDSELRGVADAQKNKCIIDLSKQKFNDSNNPPLYCFTDDDAIKINPNWKTYLLRHLGILQGFSYWHLTNYIQKNNPNVPNIIDKLFPPESRVLTNARNFWKAYFEVKKNLTCIYSGQILENDKFSIDHFLPWSFVSHDLLWNLLPVTQSVNSSKGDNVPAEKYLEKFSNLQFDAFQVAIRHESMSKRNLEDYVILFKQGIPEIAKLSRVEFGEVLGSNIKPLMQIAANMGFQTNWSYRKL